MSLPLPCKTSPNRHIDRSTCPKGTVRLRAMRLVVARCSVSYTGRGITHLPEAVRLVMFKADGTVTIWSDGGGPKVKPLNWMTPPTAIDSDGERIVVRQRAGKSEDLRELRLFESTN